MDKNKYSSLKKIELIKLIKEKGISGYSKLNKKELIKLLKNNSKRMMGGGSIIHSYRIEFAGVGTGNRGALYKCTKCNNITTIKPSNTMMYKLR